MLRYIYLAAENYRAGITYLHWLNTFEKLKIGEATLTHHGTLQYVQTLLWLDWDKLSPCLRSLVIK